MPTHKPLPYRIRAELFSQLTKMESAGLPFDRALSVLHLAEAGQARLVSMVSLLKRHDFAMAGERSGLFTRLEARLIHAAVSTGSPAHMFGRLAECYTARAMQVATMKSRMVMPAGVFLLALIIEPLPGLASGSLGLFGYLFQVLRPLFVVAAIFFAARWWLSWQLRPVDEAKQKAASPLCSILLLGRLIVRQNVRDYFESLALMLEAGLPMLDALPLAIDTITEPPIKREFSRVAPRMAGGVTLSKAVADLAFLGSAHSRQRLISFIHTGEQSGTLPEMLLRHTVMETGAINDTFELLATWAPRVVYGLVALWMIVSIFSAPGLAPPQLGG